MSFDLKLFSNKIKQCRLQLQLEQAEVSVRTGIEMKRFEILESGKVEPRGDEVLILADFFKQDYQFFISNQQKTAFEKVQILYRKFGDEFEKEERWAIQEFLFLCECEQLTLIQ